MSKNNPKNKWMSAKRRSPLKDVSCIYRVQVLDPADPSRFITIPRFAAPDPEGIIEIGMTRNLSRRMSYFKRAVLGSDCEYAEGQMLHYSLRKCKTLRDWLGSNEKVVDLLRFTYFKMAPGILRSKEREAIDYYCGIYGEPPVLNSQVPGRRKIFGGRAGNGSVRPSPLRMQGATPRKIGGEWTSTTSIWPLTGLSCIYRVHLLRHDDPSRYFPIPRFAGTDPEGILEIGHTRDLANRMSRFRQAVVGKTRHCEGQLLHYLLDICGLLREAHGPKEEVLNSLLFTYKKTKATSLLSKESEAIDDYLSTYGEPPVLNCQVPGKRKKLRKVR